LIPITVSPDRLMFMEGSNPWTLRGVTDFSLYYLYLTNHDIKPILQDRKAVGA